MQSDVSGHSKEKKKTKQNKPQQMDRFQLNTFPRWWNRYENTRLWSDVRVDYDRQAAVGRFRV